MKQPTSTDITEMEAFKTDDLFTEEENSSQKIFDNEMAKVEN